MSDRLDAILAAAYTCFTRHGMRRTTMEDIAGEAGMSRAALYQYVRNKDDAFRRLATSLFDRALDEARTAASAPGTPVHRLHSVLSTKLELTLQLWRDSPHAAELLDASARLTGDLVESYTRELTELLTQCLSDVARDRARSVAELAVAMTRGLEAGIEDPGLLRRRLREGSALLIAGLSNASGPVT